MNGIAKTEILSNWTLWDLIEKFRDGKILVPLFQRNYEWEKSKVVSLLNSIYKHYPIGTFFLWEAEPQYRSFIRIMDDISKNVTSSDECLFILDGQQRILSVYRVALGLHCDGIDYSKIVFNPARHKFKVSTGKTEKYNYPVYFLFDEKKHQEIFTELLNDSKRIAETWNEARQIMMNYPMSIVKTSGFNIDEVVEIFERINQGGKKLTTFDLIHATTWSTDFDLRTRIQQFNEAYRSKKIGSLSEKIFTYSLAMNAFDDCKASSQLKLTPTIAKNIWSRTRTALGHAIDFLQQMGLKSDLSSYQTHLVVIQYYYFKCNQPIPDKHRKTIEKWFWDTRFSKRYSTMAHSRIKEDALWMVALIENE
ncbi:MAG TPA: DUF262 domain-containing protein [Salinivirgaceae bacterium]|nr:DUF262 domain-containing protein [Salinivirgaceae bacterium]